MSRWALLLCLALPCAAATDEQIAEGCRLAEGAPKWHQVGRHGDSGEYQITRVVWFQHSRRSFSWARSPLPEHRAEARRVAIAHVHWIREQLPLIGMPVNSYTIALCWNAGVTRIARREISDRNADFADRARNLCSP